MNWWNEDWDVVALGRAAGALIIVVGIVISGWSALDAPSQISGGDVARTFLESSLRWVYSGAFLILLAEVVAHLGWGPNRAEGQETKQPPDQPHE